jgi:predicted protein tyrosine phosphatase
VDSGGSSCDRPHRHKEPRLNDTDDSVRELTRDPSSATRTPSEAAPLSNAIHATASSQSTIAPVFIPSLKLDVSRSCSLTHEDSEAKQRREKLARFEPEATLVMDRVYVGGESPALNLSLLQKLGITHIVNCAADTTACAFEADGLFKYLRVHINDSVNDGITSHIPSVFSFMDDCLSRPEGRCLIHCTQGVSRSVSFCVAREMADRNCDYDAALAAVKAHRAIAAPNAGYANLFPPFFSVLIRAYFRFMCQLMDWRKHFGIFDKPRVYFFSPYRYLSSFICMNIQSHLLNAVSPTLVWFQSFSV